MSLSETFSLAPALSRPEGTANSAGGTDICGITLMGGKYGTLRSASVNNCAELTKALELNCTATPAAEELGISIPAAQFTLMVGQVYVLSFYVRVADVFDTLSVSIADRSGAKLTGFTYQLCGQWTRIYIPFTAIGRESQIIMAIGCKRQKVYIGGIGVEPSGGSFDDAKSGYYMVESDDWETVRIDWGEGLGIGKCMDVIAGGEYTYAIANRRLHIFKTGAEGKNPTFIKSTKPFGDLRQMSLTDDGKGLVVTARANGIFAFDISDPENPVLASRLDSLEAATGLDIQGRFCYVADRIFGVDIFDVSDLYNPVMVSNIRTGETQDCKVYNGFLYAGVWGACKVVICDVRDADNPSISGYINLRGRGDGINIKNGILYVATGHMEIGARQRESPGYGLGNGMEIYDVADPLNPVLMSRVRAEGRMYSAWPDVWRVKVSGDYAYLSSTYNGIYVYDTTNKSLPRRLAHIDVVAKKEEPGYLDLKRKNTWVYPFDSKQERRGALVSCDIRNGAMYIANESNDLYVLHGKSYLKNHTDGNDSTLFPNQKYAGSYFISDLKAKGFENVKLFMPNAQVWAVARHGKYNYVAAGLDGIYVIDDEMNLIQRHPSRDITNDIQIYKNRIYTAENRAGLCIYEIDKNNPEDIKYISSYRDGSLPIVEVALSPDARYALVQRGNSSLLLDISDMENPKPYRSFDYTMVYQNQISRRCAQNRYLMVFANGSKTVVCDFGTNGSYPTPVISESWTSGICQENGISADGDLMFATADGGLYCFDPSNMNVYSSPLTKNAHVGAFPIKEFTRGAPTIIGNYAFIARRSSGDLTILKLPADRNSPAEVLKKVTFRGSPSRLTSVGQRVYLPLGYGGLASFEIADLSPNAGLQGYSE